MSGGALPPKDGRQYPKTRRKRDDVSTDNGVPPERKPKKAEPPADDPARRYTRAANLIEGLHQKLAQLLGIDDPICDAVREVHKAASEEAAA